MNAGNVPKIEETEIVEFFILEYCPYFDRYSSNLSYFLSFLEN